MERLLKPINHDYCFTNDDGTVKVTSFPTRADDPDAHFKAVKDAMDEYVWRDKDALLLTYVKNGTHLMWEIMTMLQRGTAEYVKEPKELVMFDAYPITKGDELLPSPRVLNTHLRLDVLPKQFRGRKTVCVMRNPKDTLVSLYHHMCVSGPKQRPNSERAQRFAQMTFGDMMDYFQSPKYIAYGTFFDYTEYMWTLRDEPYMLLLFYEDIIRDKVGAIRKVDEFLGTNRSTELVQQIAEATDIAKMRDGKANSLDDMNVGSAKYAETKGAAKLFYRKGEVGDWKNHFTVAQNEMFDSVLENWTGGKHIPFKYE